MPSEPFVGSDGLATLALACAVLGLTLGGSLMLALWHVLRVARRAPPDPTGGGRVLVLGVRLRRGAVPPAFRRRLDRALALAARSEALRVVVLGGVTEPDSPSEAEAGRAYLAAAGLCPSRIATEARSRHTLENLREYRAAFGPGDVPALLVTSRSHLARAALMAEGLGIPHLPCAAEPEWRLTPAEAGRLLWEAFLVHWYLVGRGFARLTRNRGMLARIS